MSKRTAASRLSTSNSAYANAGPAQERFGLAPPPRGGSTVPAMKTVGEIAQLSGVTVKTLHHYDKIGLLKPRLYGRDELVRLREILIWSQLGFPLRDIARLIDDPTHDRAEALRRQLELAGTQLSKFQSITRGLEIAISALDEGHALSEDDVFAGFASSLADHSDNSDGLASSSPVHERITTFAILSGRSPHKYDRAFAVADGPPRIVATDPIRIAESLLALGVLPVGAGTYEDRFTEEPGTWPWPPFVEPVVRGHIRDLGDYGSDASRIQAIGPDLILDLTAPWLAHRRASLVEAASNGQYGYDFCSEIAPTTLLPYSPASYDDRPAFRHFLVEVARAIGCYELASELIATWDARVRALGAHVAGKDVAVLARWGGEGPWRGYFYSPNIYHNCSVFAPLGLTVVVPQDATESGVSWVFDEDHFGELDAGTLFVHTRHLSRTSINALLKSRSVSELPAVRRGRVFDLGWEFVNSGWFGAHWQLQLVAHAFGLTQLSAGSPNAQVFGVADPATGVVALTSSFRDMSVVISGPDLFPTRADLHRQEAATISVAPEVARNLCGLPELYSVSLDDTSSAFPFVRDRESALARLASVHEPPASVTTPWSRTRERA
jgi:ABC-type Fe3+-hydroxamate transport system substrate-binding protein/DNA-binding transcriptional MerR regulator